MDVNFKQLYHPFSKPRTQTDNFAPSFNSSAFDSVRRGYCKQGKTENANSFSDLLSGSSYYLQRENSQLSKAHSEAPASVHINDYVPVASEAQSHVSYQHAAMTVDCYGRLAGSAPKTPSFAVPGLQANLMPSHFPVLHHGSQGDSFPCDSRPDKSYHSHAFMSSANEDRALFKKNGLSTATKSVNGNISQNLDMNFTPKDSLEIKSTIAEHFVIHRRQGLRVFCMGTVGELFLNDNGLIGVVCLCHNLHMSIAKFCEHSGSFLENPGEAVHLENGETIAQWRRLLFLKAGIRVPDDDNGWLWHDCTPKSDSAVGSKDNNNNIPLFYGTQKLEPLIGFGRPGFHSNNYVPSIQSYVGHGNLENSLTGVSNNALEKNAMANQYSLIRSCSESLPTSSSLPFSDCMREKVNSCNHLETPNSIFTHRPQNIDHRPIAYHVKASGKSIADSNLQNSPILRNFSANVSANWEAFSSKKAGVSAILNEKSSNIELSLGQPSWQSYTSIGSDSESGRLQGQFDLKTPQMLELMSPRFDATKIAAESQKDRCCTLAEDFNSKISRAQHPYGIVDAIDSSGLDELNGELNKDSIISLFLSHLNTFGGSSSQASGNNFISKDNRPPEGADINSYTGYGTYLSRKLSSSSEKPFEMIRDDKIYLVKKGKDVTSSEKRPSDAGRPVEAFQGHSFHLCPSMLNCNNSGCENTFSERLVKDIDPRTVSQYGRTLFFTNPVKDDHTSLKYPSSIIFPPTGPSFLSGSLPINHSSMSSTCTTGTISSFTCKKNPEVHLHNENSRFIALEHMKQLPRQEVVSSTLNKTYQEGRTCCPLSVDMQTKDSHLDMTSLAERRCGPHCSINKDFLVPGANSLPPCCHSCVTVLEPAGLSTCCHQTLPIQGDSSCSKECCCLYRLCHVCGAQKWPLLKCCGIDNAKKKISNISGSFGCHFLSTCMAGYCIPRNESNHHASTKHKECSIPQVIHSPVFSGGLVHSNNKSSLIDHGSLNGKTDTQMAQWRDVPGKSTPKTIACSIEKPQQMVQDADVTEGRVNLKASKQFNDAFVDGKAMMKQQLSNASSGCSAPAVTEVSVDANNVSSYEASNRDRCLANDPVDEESVAGKDSSSDEISNHVIWEKSLPSDNMDSTRGPESLPCQLTDPLLNNLIAQHTLKPKSSEYPFQTKGSVGEKSQLEHSLGLQKTGKRNRTAAKWKNLDTSLLIPGSPLIPSNSANCIHKPEQPFPPQEIMQHSIQSCNTKQNACIIASKTDFERKRSDSACAKLLSLSKSDDHGTLLEDNHLSQTCDTSPIKVHKGSHCKKFDKLTVDCKNPFTKTDNIHRFAEKHSKFISLSEIERFSRCETKHSERKPRPEVCDNSGIIWNGDPFEESRPPKMVSLSSILNDKRSCIVAENEPVCRQNNMEMKKNPHITVEINCNKIDVQSQEQENESKDDTCEIIYPKKKKKCFHRNARWSSISFPIKKGKKTIYENFTSSTENDHGEFLISSKSQRYKETRKRRLDELNGQKHPSDAGKDLEDIESLRELLRLYPSSNSQKFKDHNGNLSQEDAIIASDKGNKCQTSPLYSDEFCCVCGSSDKDDINRLIECRKCLIRVHQACYGILKVPKGSWCCRPCRTNSKNIACVLCGYEGGAMTRAIRSRSITRSLLKCWQVEKGSKPLSSLSSENIVNKLKAESINEPPKCCDPSGSSVSGPLNSDYSSRMSMKMDLRSRTNSKRKFENSRNIFWLQNSITAGVLDPSTAQWVHMVCGLWTPGTRCPNVDTMSTFDVSGAFSIKKGVVCTMCNRPGGSCIRCRVSDCSAHFHPWCAHKKGLLQSETEGSDDENVGFYGRCLLHAPYQKNCSESGAAMIELKTSWTNDFSCARVEGYKGRKKEWFDQNLWRHTNETAGYVVPQEQINMWLRISSQKLHSGGRLKPPVSESESACRKEYIRFKQAKEWKHLVVYKSGIHALGLYTTRFIACGAMVVEYVGEIVGLRVADKREIGYQSGRRLQYKSACYFFRIDREYIIDATRKGGIARFVNHSCLPNCVAKVISVKNEKKVVFFAERDINPGDEITYDYHFNHEDEGQKIPCFCKSKNCRRYLN